MKESNEKAELQKQYARLENGFKQYKEQSQQELDFLTDKNKRLEITLSQAPKAPTPVATEQKLIDRLIPGMLQRLVKSNIAETEAPTLMQELKPTKPQLVAFFILLVVASVVNTFSIAE